MKFGNVQITRKTKEGSCFHCEKAIEVKTYHVTVTIRIGPKKGHRKNRFINWHLHIDCLGVWLIAQMVARQDRRKPPGRPLGSGLGLSKEDKARRLAILKRRARLFKEIEACPPKDKRLVEFFNRFESIEQELGGVGGPAPVNRRTTMNIRDIERKLLFGRSIR